MEYRTLGRTGLNVSLLSYGTGGYSILGQTAGLTHKQQDALIARALDGGINLFDTSPQYRQSEDILGRTLAGVARDSYVMVTKWNHDLWGQGLDPTLVDDPDTAIASVEQSLKSLRTDYVDVLLVHGLQIGQYTETVERFYPAMRWLREQGKCRFIGLSERFPADPKNEATTLALRSHPELWDVTMLKYGILNQYAAREALPLVAEHNVGVLNMAAVRRNLTQRDRLEALIADWKARGLIAEDSVPDEDPLGWLVGGDVASVTSAGYKFAAEHPAVSTVLTGTSSIEHLDDNLAAMETPRLPAADSERLAELFGALAEPED